MSIELVLWFIGCAAFLLVLLLVARPYILQHHEDEPESEEPTADSNIETFSAEEPDDPSVHPPS